MTFEELLRAIVREEITRALDERLPQPKPIPEILYERVSAFARRVAISERTIWTYIKQGLPTIGSGRGRRVDVQAAIRWLTDRSDLVDDRIEKMARASARRAAERAMKRGRKS